MRFAILLSATMLKYGMDTPIPPLLGGCMVVLLFWDIAEAGNRWR